ncbi:MAG: FGGY family carbohydrate kinase [Anaerolineae bacterium]
MCNEKDRTSAQLLPGIDVGTSSVKGLVCDEEGQVVVLALREHALYAPCPGWAEESPAEWWENVVAVVHARLAHPQVVPDCIAAVGVASLVSTVGAETAGKWPRARRAAAAHPSAH